MAVAVKAVKHSAPGPYLGFALQPVRLCYHLLTCPNGAKVSLEYLDDVAIHHADDSVTLEQDKSALRRNPLSDWAEELWKAIANWLNGISGGQFCPGKTSFHLYVTPARHPGDLVKMMSNASTEADVATITNVVKMKHARLRTAKGSELFVQRFLDASNAERNAVILPFTLLNRDVNPVEPLRDLIKTTVASEIIDMLCQAAIGMAKEQADQLIREGKPALIDGDIFKANFIALVRRTNIPGLLSSVIPPPAEEKLEATLLARPIFIRQLEIINAADAERLRAVSDYLRASADKSTWAEQGRVFESSLLELDDGLIWRHQLIGEEIADLHGTREAAIRGRMVYRRCAQLDMPLEGQAVPNYFIHGCFNALADIMRVGWHPDYQSLLAEDAE